MIAHPSARAATPPRRAQVISPSGGDLPTVTLAGDGASALYRLEPAAESAPTGGGEGADGAEAPSA
eukprot:1842303-Prymnesium_polylepis.1